MKKTATVLLEDETLRDGLQVEARLFSLEEKLAMYDGLESAGIGRIQVGSFVHPKRVPQMADTDEFIRIIKEKGDSRTILSGLILNERGLERAMDCGLGHLSMSVSVSDAHSRKNAGKPAREALAEMAALVNQAVKAGVSVRAGIQCSFGCVYEGAVAEELVEEAALVFAEHGAGEINLADSTGMANPKMVERLVKRVGAQLPGTALSLHLHDTRGLGLVNMYAGYLAGVRTFDVCVGGLGGCPFIKGAAGNVPTEDAVNMFSSLGIETGIDIPSICNIVNDLEKYLERSLPGKMKKVLSSQSHHVC